MKISDNIENTILNSIDNYDQSYTLGNPFEELMSMGELVDRLSIVNFKLFKLVRERARLKKCIDEKVISMFTRYKSGDVSAGFNPEVKKYGNE